MESRLATGTELSFGRKRAPVTGPHVATIVFLVIMLSGAAIAFANHLANRDGEPGNRSLAMEVEETPESAVESAPDQPDDRKHALDPAAAPPITAEAVFAIDSVTGEVLFAENEDEERDIGSTVKIVTALVVVDHAELDDEVTIEESDLVDTLVYSNMNLTAGDTLTVEQLLTGLLIPSGSDSARALARHVGGLIDPESDDPEDVFTDAMNQRAEALGLEHSSFANADGNDAGNSHSSARDIALASAELLKHPVLAGIVSQTEYSFISVGPEAREYTGVTTNQLLKDGYPGVSGVKTGSTEEAGGCVVLAQVHPVTGNTIIVAVLGSDLTYVDGWIDTDARWDDARALLAWLDGEAR
jgi:D-alanyl-D-alanine carboxypeptidase